MPLFRRNRNPNNPKKFSENLKTTPVKIAGDAAATSVRFVNAKPSTIDEKEIKNNIGEAREEDISVSEHPSISSGRIIEFFTGEPQNINIEPPTGNTDGDCEFSPEGFLSNIDCVVSYMFAHIVPRRRAKGGFRNPAPNTSDEIPYSPEIGTIEPEDADLPFQVMFVEQDLIDNGIIRLSSARIQHRRESSGVSVIRNETLDIDTWYNGRFENFNVGNNVSVGYLNDDEFSWEPGDRYNWTHGTINFTSNIASEWIGETCVVSGSYLDISDCEDTVIVECNSKQVEISCPPPSGSTPETSSSPTSSCPTSSSPTSSCPTSSSPTSSCPTSSCPTSSQPLTGNNEPCYDTIAECKSITIPFDPKECGVNVPILVPDPESVIIYDGELTGDDSVIKETVNGTEVKAVYTDKSISLIAWKFFVFSIGSEEDPYKEIHNGTNFLETDASISAPIKINYFDKKYGKAKYVSKLKTLTEGSKIKIGENAKGNLVIAKK